MLLVTAGAARDIAANAGYAGAVSAVYELKSSICAAANNSDWLAPELILA